MSEQPVIEQLPLEQTAPQPKPRAAARILQVAVTYAWFIASLFIAAGRWDWLRGWISVALWTVGMTAMGLIIQRYNPELMAQRARWPRKDTKRFDKVFMALFMPLVLLHPAIAGLDAVRFRWSSMPFAFVYAGAILFALATVLTGWVMAINPYAESTVRIQTDRGQTVVTSGPYRFVRHPMYVGITLLYLGPPLVWGSVWALVVSGIIILLFLWRTAREDRTLRQELPGYEQYATQTRYRLLPGVW